MGAEYYVAPAQHSVDHSLELALTGGSGDEGKAEVMAGMRTVLRWPVVWMIVGALELA